jgi:hypothetical protein
MSKVSRKYNNRNLRRKYSVKKQHRFQRSKKGGAVAVAVNGPAPVFETTTGQEPTKFKKTGITINGGNYILFDIITINNPIFGKATETIAHLEFSIGLIQSITAVQYPSDGVSIKRGLKIEYITGQGNPKQIINIWASNADTTSINALNEIETKIRTLLYPSSN